MQSDEQLIDATLAGDIDSFSLLAKRYYTPIVALAYRWIGDHHLAEDAAQEALAKALVKLATLRHKGRFGIWLGRIARNTARDIARRQPREIDLDQADHIAAAEAKPATGAEQAVHQAMARLSDGDQELVTLRYFDHCSYEQISSLLGISPAAIHGRLYRAKRKIARYLARTNFHET